MNKRAAPNSRTRIKLCGITRPQDAEYAATLGVDAIGLMFYAKSPRAINIEQAQAICALLPPFVSVVGVFVDATATEIADTVGQVPLDVVQLHGHETPAACAQVPCPYYKAIGVQDMPQLTRQAAQYPQAKALLLDRFDPEKFGGTGQTFDWSQIPNTIKQPLILAGGLNPDNVIQAIQRVQPYAVDVSGGIEAAPGIKEPAKMAAFVAAVKRADNDKL